MGEEIMKYGRRTICKKKYSQTKSIKYPHTHDSSCPTTLPPMASSSSSSRLFFSNFLSAPSSSSPSPSLIPRRSPSFRFETATNYSKQLKMKRTSSFQDRSIAICFALAESSDSPNPIGKGEDERKKKEELRILLQELVVN